MPSLELTDFSDLKGFNSIKATIQGLTGIWKGQVQNGLPHGKGALFMENENKQILEGECVNERFVGQYKQVNQD